MSSSIFTHQIFANGSVSCLKGSRSVLTTSFCGNKLIDRFDTAIASKSSAALSKTDSLGTGCDYCQGLDIPLCVGLLLESPLTLTTCGSLALTIPILCSSFSLSKCQFLNSSSRHQRKNLSPSMFFLRDQFYALSSSI